MREIINILIHLFGIFITIFFSTQCYALLANKKLIFSRRNFFILVILTLLILLNNMFMIVEIKAAVAFLIMILCLNLLFKDKLKKTFIIYVIIYMVLMLLEIVLSNVIFTFNLIPISAFSITLVNSGLSILIALIQYGLFKIPFVKKVLIKLIDNAIYIATLMNVLYLLIFSLLVVGIFNVYNNETTESYKIIIIIICIFAILFIYLINTIINSNVLKLSNKKLIEYNDKYSKFLEEYKIYKHNIKNKLLSIKSYGNKKVNDLIDNLVEEETSFTIKNNNIYNLPNGIKGIIAEKLYNINIDVVIDNKIKNDPFAKLSPKAFNSLSECLGIALDNAIEASKETDEPIVIVNLNEDKENIFIKIGNNFSNNIDIEKLGEKYYSTKNRGSGLGLFSIQMNKLVKENITIINNFYYIELQIKKGCNKN